MSATEQPSPSSPRKGHRRLRRLAWVLGVFSLFGVTLVLGFRAYFLSKAEKRYEAACAEADRLDPGWRWEDIQARREVVPDEENSAPIVLAAANLLPDPENWEPGQDAVSSRRQPGFVPRRAQAPNQPSLEEEIRARPVNERLPKRLEDELRTELEKVKPALEQARQLADLNRGRYEVQWKKDLFFTLVPHVPRARTLARLLALDAMGANQAGDCNRALHSCRSILNVCRSLGDEPSAASQLARLACGQIAAKGIELTLAQGEIPPEALATLQQPLTEEATHPFMLLSVRAERVAVLQTWDLIYSGEMDLEEFSGSRKKEISLPRRFWNWLYVRPLVRLNQADYLERITKAVEYAKQGPSEAREGFDKLVNEARITRANAPYLALGALMIPALDKLLEAQHRCQAQLHNARLALGAERFRLANGRWPESLQQLVPQFIDRIPDDPFGEGPLRLRRRDDGLVIYSVGKNQADDGGDVTQDLSKSRDLGFRLWDPDRRGLPPSARPVAIGDEPAQ